MRRIPRSDDTYAYLQQDGSRVFIWGVCCTGFLLVGFTLMNFVNGPANKAQEDETFAKRCIANATVAYLNQERDEGTTDINNMLIKYGIVNYYSGRSNSDYTENNLTECCYLIAITSKGPCFGVSNCTICLRKVEDRLSELRPWGIAGIILFAFGVTMSTTCFTIILFVVCKFKYQEYVLWWRTCGQDRYSRQPT